MLFESSELEIQHCQGFTKWEIHSLNLGLLPFWGLVEIKLL